MDETLTLGVDKLGRIGSSSFTTTNTTSKRTYYDCEPSGWQAGLLGAVGDRQDAQAGGVLSRW